MLYGTDVFYHNIKPERVWMNGTNIRFDERTGMRHMMEFTPIDLEFERIQFGSYKQERKDLNLGKFKCSFP